MALLELSNATKYYGGRCVIKDLSFAVHAGEKIGLIGRNGCGKTTLLRMIAGMEEIDDGTIAKASGMVLGYLRQQDELAGDESLTQAMQQVFAPLIGMENSLRKLEAEMSRPEVYEDEERLAEVSARYARFSHQFEAQGGYAYPSRIKAVLFGLGFRESQLDQPLGQMSGGQRMRAALAKILLTEPDLLLLDEPTNHLDLDATQWLEEYLKGYKGAVLVVSHDRYFLDRIVTKIVEIEHEEGAVYRGNYSAALHQKVERLKLQAEEYRRTVAERAKLQDYIRRFQYGTRASMAQSRFKMLARLKPVELPKTSKTMHMSFAPTAQSGTKVLYLEGISKGFDHRLFGPVETVVERGERIAIVGPNGSGKSTLLSVITGIYEPDEGSLRWGTGVEWSYFRQGLDDLDDQLTVFEEMLNCEEMTNEEARTVLGRFLFSGEDVYKKVGNLSGGERSRLTLAKLFIQGANLLILDEPTNHLDIPAKEALEKALVDFPGTVIFVSHDRYFIDQVATRVWEIKDFHLRMFEGGYSLYQEVLLGEREAAEAVRQSAIVAQKEQNAQARAKERGGKAAVDPLIAVEEEISQLEAEKTALELQMAEPGFYQDENCKEKVGRYHHVTARLDELYQQWEQVSDAMS